VTGADAKAALGTAEGKADAPKEEIRKMSGLASLFKREKISRPQPIDTADNQQHVFPGTNIKVQSQRIAATGGDYKAIVFQHLSDINAFPIGRHFLQALTTAGKNVLIVYGGPNVNQAAGSVAGYVLLRRYHDAHENANFAAELRQTMTNAGLSTQQLAQQLWNTQLHSWAGNITPNPFQGLPILPPPQPRPGAPAVPPKPPSLKGEVLLNQWLAGTSLPTYDQMDVLMLTLARRHIKPGKGVGTRINYDPHKTTAGVDEQAAASGSVS
jgi:hypothetical protein